MYGSGMKLPNIPPVIVEIIIVLMNLVKLNGSFDLAHPNIVLTIPAIIPTITGFINNFCIGIFIIFMEQRVFYVKPEEEKNIPETIKVYEILPSKGLWEYRFSKKYKIFKLKSIESEGEWLKVVYELQLFS